MCLYLNYTATRLTRALGTDSYSLHLDSRNGKSMVWIEEMKSVSI